MFYCINRKEGEKWIGIRRSTFSSIVLPCSIFFQNRCAQRRRAFLYLCPAANFAPFLLWKAETPSHTRARAHATENSHVSYVFFLMAELSSFPRIDPFPFPSPLPSTFPRGLVIPFPRIDLRSSPQFHQPSLSSNTQKSSSSTYILGQRANFLNRVAKLEIEFSQVFRLEAAVFDNGIFTYTGFQIRLGSEQCRLFDQR